MQLMTHTDLHELLASLAGQPDGPSPESIRAAERVIDWCADGGLLLPECHGADVVCMKWWFANRCVTVECEGADAYGTWAAEETELGEWNGLCELAVLDWAATTALLAELLPLRTAAAMDA